MILDYSKNLLRKYSMYLTVSLYMEVSKPPPPLQTVYVRVYSINIHTGGGGELNQREGKRGNSSQSWVKNTKMTGCISSLKTLINICRKVPLQVNIFR